MRDPHGGASLPRRIARAAVLALLALAVGLLAGVLVRLLLTAIALCQRALWGALPAGPGAAALLPLAICTLGGLVIGLWTKRFGGAPDPLPKIAATVRETGAYRVKSIPASLGGFALPFIFGGSVGPCSGVAGIVASACTSIRDRLERAGLDLRGADDLGISAAFTAVFGAPFAGIVAADEASPAGADGPLLHRVTRIVVYAITAAGAFAGMALFDQLTGTGGGLPRLQSTGFSARDLPWMLVSLLAAWALALLFTLGTGCFARLSRRLQRYPVAKAVGCGVVLGIVGIVLPTALFSGEAQVAQIATSWQMLPAGMLLAAAIAKAVLTPLCMQFGWGGGPLFPCVFMGVAAGYGISGLAGVDPVCCAAVSTGALLACCMHRPVFGAALLLLVFPPQSLVWLLLASLVGALLPLPRPKKADAAAHGGAPGTSDDAPASPRD